MRMVLLVILVMATDFLGGLFSDRLNQAWAEAATTKTLDAHQLQLVDNND